MNTEAVRRFHVMIHQLENVYSDQSGIVLTPESIPVLIAARDALLAQGEWQDIATLKDAPDIVLAGVPACSKFPNGRVMPYGRDLLLQNLKGPTPEHLQFPATGWKPLPEAPKR